MKDLNLVRISIFYWSCSGCNILEKIRRRTTCPAVRLWSWQFRILTVGRSTIDKKLHWEHSSSSCFIDIFLMHSVGLHMVGFPLCILCMTHTTTIPTVHCASIATENLLFFLSWCQSQLAIVNVIFIRMSVGSSKNIAFLVITSKHNWHFFPVLFKFCSHVRSHVPT